MTRTDADLERDLRTMLHRRALDVPEVEPEVVPSLVVRRANGRRMGRRVTALVGLAAAVAVALPVAVALTDDDGGGDATTEIGPGTQEPGDGSPLVGADGTPLRAAAPLFEADGSPRDVVLAYLAARVVPGRIDGVDQVVDTALVRWSAVDDTGQATPGTVELHRVDGRWGVYATTSAALDVDVAVSGELLVGAVTTTDGATVCVDVLLPTGEPVPWAPHLDGADNVPAGLGSVGCSPGEVTVEIPVGTQPVIVRATRIDRGIAAISEVRLDPGAPITAGDLATTTTEIVGFVTTTLPESTSTAWPVTTTTIDGQGTTGPVIDRSTIRIAVYNGAGIQGIAGAMTDELMTLGYAAADPGTSETQVADTRIYAQAGSESACDAVRLDFMAVNSEVDLSGLVVQALDPATTPVTGSEGADCVVLVGQDLAGGATSSTVTVVTTTTVVPPAG